MEADSIPVTHHWLEAILNELAARSPFSVLGAHYAGHNWDKYPIDSNIVTPALRNHLNGNAVYNTSHPLLQEVLMTWFQHESNWLYESHSSFDIYISELLFEIRSVASVIEAETAPYEYKSSNIFSNMATTLTLPQDIDTSGNAIVHGAVYLHNWPLQGCERAEGATYWYPKRDIVVTGESTSLTLIVSDFGNEGDLHSFMRSLEAARSFLAGQVSAQTCPSGNALPFMRIVVVTSDADRATKYRNTYQDPMFKFVARDWSKGGSAWWDICNIDVDSKWFMQVSACTDGLLPCPCACTCLPRYSVMRSRWRT